MLAYESVRVVQSQAMFDLLRGDGCRFLGVALGPVSFSFPFSFPFLVGDFLRVPGLGGKGNSCGWRALSAAIS